MTTTHTDPGKPSATAVVGVQDDRTFYRRALALVAPLPMMATELGYWSTMRRRSRLGAHRIVSGASAEQGW